MLIAGGMCATRSVITAGEARRVYSNSTSKVGDVHDGIEDACSKAEDAYSETESAYHVVKQRLRTRICITRLAHAALRLAQ